MSDLPELQARAGELERAIAETDDQHGSLLSGLERGLSQLRERLVGATAANDRLTRENAELTAIAEQLLARLENQPAEALHDKLAALDGQLHGLLELSGVPAPANGAPPNGTPVNATPVNGTPVAAGDDGAPAKGAPGAASESASEDASEAASDSGGGPFEEIRERMRALSSHLLATPSAPTDGPVPAQSSAPIQPSTAGPPPKPAPERDGRRIPGAPRAFDRPIRALAEKAQSVLPKVRLRFDAETDYALAILRRIRGGRQPFGIEEVRELINGKFGLNLTDRDDAQLSASLANQDGLTRGPRGPRGPRGDGAGGARSWRFERG